MMTKVTILYPAIADVDFVSIMKDAAATGFRSFEIELVADPVLTSSDPALGGN